MIANARMYAVCPAAAVAWRTLLDWVFAHAGVTGEVFDYPAPQPLSALWARPDLACAFMCGYPFATAATRPTLLAAPVPSPAPYGERPVYWTEIVVAATASFERVEDIFGGRFAWTAEDSQSGWQAPRLLLAPHAQRRGSPLFSTTVGPLVTPREVALAVAEGRADAGPLDSYALALLRLHEPALAARLRVIAQTPRNADSAARGCGPPRRRRGAAAALRVARIRRGARARGDPSVAPARQLRRGRRRRLRPARRRRAGGRRARLSEDRVIRANLTRLAFA